MIHIDSSSPKSIYEQIYEGFIMLISTGVLKPDEQLPSVRDLAAMIRINPNTIQKAYKLLENKDFIYSVPGKGNFVSNSDALVSAEVQLELEKFRGVVRTLKILGLSQEKITDEVNEIFKGGRKHAGS